MSEKIDAGAVVRAVIKLDSDFDEIKQLAGSMVDMDSREQRLERYRMILEAGLRLGDVFDSLGDEVRDTDAD